MDPQIDIPSIFKTLKAYLGLHFHTIFDFVCYGISRIWVRKSAWRAREDTCQPSVHLSVTSMPTNLPSLS